MRTTRNVNDEVIVKLTPAGERVYTMRFIRDTLNKDSVYSFSIWELMTIFGKDIGGTELLFESNKLVFPEVIEYELNLEE